MMRLHDDELYLLEWACGVTDVFADAEDALDCYGDDAYLAEYAAEGGKWVPIADVQDGWCCPWSDAATAKAAAFRGDAV